MRRTFIVAFLVCVAVAAAINVDDILDDEDESHDKRQMCKDNKSKCPRWHSYCARNSWVRINCRLTCNQCTKPRPTKKPLPRCKDNMSRCQSLRSRCARSSWVRRNCRATCNQCTKPRPTKKPLLPRCKDNTSRCRSMRSHCTRNSWVRRTCRLTCNQCTKPRPTKKPSLPRCNPRNIEGSACATWKSRGYCHRSHRYFAHMKTRCPGTCGLCLKVVRPVPTKPTGKPVFQKTHTVKVNIRECLDAHNAYRARHGAPKLEWDSKLAQQSQIYALKLAKMKKLKHDQNNRGKFGENLASSYKRNRFTCKDATKMWYDEVKLYSYSNPRFAMATGHFTQVVWKSSKRLGVGIARNGDYTYVVARYSPPGNYAGRFKENVGRAGRRG